MEFTRLVKNPPRKKVNVVNPGLIRWGRPPGKKWIFRRRRRWWTRGGRRSRRGDLTPTGVPVGVKITLGATKSNFWGSVTVGGALVGRLTAGTTGYTGSARRSPAGAVRVATTVAGWLPPRATRPVQWRRPRRRGPWEAVQVDLTGWAHDRRWKLVWEVLGPHLAGRVHLVIRPARRSHNGMRQAKPRRV